MGAVPEPEHAADAEALLKELAKRRKGGFFDAVIVAVDAGVDAGGGKGERRDPKQRGAARLFQEGKGDEVRFLIDEQGAEDREKAGDAQPAQQDAETAADGIFRFGRHKFGNGALDAGGAKRKGRCV